VMFRRSPLREFYCAPVLEHWRDRQSVQVLEAG
jgi:hypothetical protein